MDYLTKKELDGLAKDIKSKEVAVEAYKAKFENELKNGLGNDIFGTLNFQPEISQKQKSGFIHKLINLLTTKRTRNP